MKSFIQLPVVCAACALTAVTSGAGPNQGGTLVVGRLIPLSSSCSDPCDPVDGQSCWVAPGSCPELQVDLGFEGLAGFGLFATFDESTTPWLSQIAFGLEYDPSFALSGVCPVGGGSEVTSAEWPESGSGTLVTLESPSNLRFQYVYSFGGYAYEYYGATSVQVVPHPSLGAVFYDDSLPPIADAVVALGSLGFGMPGFLPCAEYLGACCLGGHCSLAFESDCLDAGGEFFGSNSDCENVECLPTPVVTRGWGQLKAAHR